MMDMGLYEVSLFVSLLGFGIETMRWCGWCRWRMGRGLGLSV